MIKLRFLSAFIAACVMPMTGSAAPSQPTGNASRLAPHRAVYDIEMTAMHSGSQVINISGQMTYETKPSCGGWLTDHHFKLFYQYAEGPGMQIASDFSTFENDDGSDINFSSRRTRDGDMYQEIRGHAQKTGQGGEAVYTMPENTRYDLTPGTLFPVSHTEELINHARRGEKFFSSIVFDGSDEEGPLDINAFIGKEVKARPDESKKIDASLLKNKAWNVRMAVFPEKDKEEESDYEMSMVFHENGVISDMVIDYDEFTVKQKLVALEKISSSACMQSVPTETNKR